MKIKKFIVFNKKLILQIILTIFYVFASPNIYAQGFIDLWETNNVTSLASSEHKPQSKTWYYGGYWWAVIPVDEDTLTGDPRGAYLWRLDGGTSWTKLMRLSSSYGIQADTRAIGSVTHILLQRRHPDLHDAFLVSIEFVPGTPPTYQLWTQRTSVIEIDLDNNLQAATIDIDGTGRMWLASDAYRDINVRWSDTPYSVWNPPITLNVSDVVPLDICAVTAFGNKIGVLWSNQRDEEFQFRYHVDGNNPATWSSQEIASGSQSGEVADDHINFAVGNDGTIYAAVKTSYDSDDYPTIALLEREPSSTWNFYGVQNGNGTRPIALLDEDDDEIFVVYQEFNGGGKIMYKYSSINSINFPTTETRLNPFDTENYQDVTSTKQNFTSEVAILFTVDHTDHEWTSVLAGTEPLPVELSAFNAVALEDKVILNWRTETEVSNYGFDIERLVENSEWETLGFVEGHGNSNSPKDYSFIDHNIYMSGQYNYRLKQIDNDGQFEYSNIISINVGVPANFYLSQNYPNPFNPSTNIDYSIPQASKVSLKIYDILGREVVSLVDEFKEAGTYTVTFDASNLPGGIYFYTIAAGNFMETKKMSLVK